MIYIISGLIFGFITYKIAESKGRDKNFAFLMGFLFGIIAIIIYAVMGDKK
jgi:flagellar biogenesis protein FliO